MNYANPRLRDRLAAEYVLGTLAGAARRRFERLLLGDPALRRLVTAWEARLAPWLRRVAPVAPPARIWRRINRRLDPQGAAAPWRWTAALSAAAAVVLALALAFFRPVPESAFQATHLALFSAEGGVPAWLVEADLEAGELRMRALAVASPPTNRSYELWMLPEQGPPVSLGLMPPAGHSARSLPPALAERLRRAQGLAVSLEPRGGSPSGQPTGPVLFSTQWIRGG